MSRRAIPNKTITRLWVLAGGRCQYEGCNTVLWRDNLTLTGVNAAYVAHIVAAEEGGPRGDATHSPRLACELSNLMLMCDVHHRLIDEQDIAGHSVDRLTAMKLAHEARIELLTSLHPDRKSHVLLYGANIGSHTASISWEKAGQAMLPDRFPAERNPIALGLVNSACQDYEDGFWVAESDNLKRLFTTRLQPRLASGEIHHLSVFALAPQPLLIQIGRLLSDIPAADVYQLHREPPNWVWQEHPEGFQYSISRPTSVRSAAALVLSLSATIDDSRIIEVLGKDTSIWRLSVLTPSNDFLKSRRQLQLFREACRNLFDEIKARHGERATIHLFPAVPVAIAVEIGRVWMPKADLPLCVYDQNHSRGGFRRAIDFNDH